MLEMSRFCPHIPCRQLRRGGSCAEARGAQALGGVPEQQGQHQPLGPREGAPGPGGAGGSLIPVLSGLHRVDSVILGGILNGKKYFEILLGRLCLSSFLGVTRSHLKKCYILGRQSCQEHAHPTEAPGGLHLVSPPAPGEG